MIPAWPAVIAAFGAAAVFFTAIGLPLARAVAPRGMPPLAMAPALGWAVFMTLALPLLSAIGFGWIAVTAFAVVALASAAALARLSSPGPTVAMPAPALAAALAVLPTVAIMPKTAASGILLAPPVFDHVKIAIVDAILRSGLPVPNPFYGPGGTGHLAYYYLWHFGAAMLGCGLHVGGWTADATMTGFTAYASLMLVFGAVVALGGRALGVAAACALVLAGTARPVLSAITGGPWLEGFVPRTADLGGWLNQAAWVPQHLASACCLILAALLLLRLAARGGWLVATVLGVVAAAGFESSVWIGGVTFAVTACALGGMLVIQVPGTDRAIFVLRALGAAALSAILVWPFIVADLQIVRLRHAGAGMALQPYAVLGAAIPPVWRHVLDGPAFWVILLPLALPAILPLALRALLRRRGADERALAQTFWVSAASCLCVAWLLRSTIDNNDLGWRAVLPAILLLTAIASAELARLLHERSPLPIAAALAVAVLAAPDTWRMLREYAGGQRPGDPHGFAASQPLWQALRRHSGPLDRIANNPLLAGAVTPWPVNIAWATLSDRPSCFSGWETMIAYGPLSRAQLSEASDLFKRVFDGVARPGDIHALARTYDCAAVGVVRSDGAWSRDPFAAAADYGVAEEGADFRVYVRR